MTTGRSCSTTALALFGRMPLRRDRTTSHRHACAETPRRHAAGTPAFAGLYVFLCRAFQGMQGHGCRANPVIIPRILVQDDRKILWRRRLSKRLQVAPGAEERAE